MLIVFFFSIFIKTLSGIAETVEIVQEAGGYCKGYVVDISKKEDVYKAADVIREEVGDVSTVGDV